MANGDTQQPSGWMSDVQRALALLIIGVIVMTAAALVLRMIISGDIAAVIDLAKSTLSNLTNMGLIALGFFFGNTKAKIDTDAGQQKVMDKLTSTPPGSLPPQPPGQSPTPWWSKLTDAEKTAITAAAPNDPRVNAFVIASATGAAAEDDLTYLASKNLLTPERVDEIKKP